MNKDLDEVIKRLGLIFNKKFGYSCITPLHRISVINYADLYNKKVEFTCWNDSYSYILDIGFLYANSDLTTSKRIYILTEIVSDQYINDYSYDLVVDESKSLDDIFKCISLGLNNVFLLDDFGYRYEGLISEIESNYHLYNSIFITYSSSLQNNKNNIKNCFVSFDIKRHIPSLMVSMSELKESCNYMFRYLIFQMTLLIRQQINIQDVE